MTTISLEKVGGGDPQQDLLNQAIAFFCAGSRCSADIALTPLVHHSPMAPAVVCYAFAVELYLKLLHSMAVGDAKKVHNLWDLYKAFPTDVKARVSGNYQGGPASFEQHLQKVDGAFVKWRYLHETPTASINPQVLVMIATALHVTCRQLNNNLVVAHEAHINFAPQPSESPAAP